MRKKILRPKIYPLSLDLSKRWYVRGWKTYNGKDKRVNCWVESLPTLDERLAAAKAIIEGWTQEFEYQPREKRFKSATAQVGRLFAFLEEIRPSLRRKTYASYKSHLKLLDNYCRQRGANGVDEATAKAFLADMTKSGRSARTVNAYRITFKSLFARLVKEKRARNNPFENTERVVGYSKGSSYFKTHQIAELKKHMLLHAPHLWTAVRFIYYCYIRPGELRNVKIGDIDFDEWQIKVRGSVSKNKREQWVAIPEALRREIEPLCLYQFAPDCYLIGKDGAPSKEQVGINYWGYWHLKMLRQLGFSEQFNLYSWKHTGVVRAYKAGIGLKELQLQLRHHSLDMVKIYLESLGILDFKNIKEVFPSI